MAEKHFNDVWNVPDEKAITKPSHLLVLGSAPFFFTGHWWFGTLFLISGLTMLLCNAIYDLQEHDRLETRYNIIQPQEILEDMKIHLHEQQRSFSNSHESLSTENDMSCKNCSIDHRQRRVFIAGLRALSNKYAKQSNSEITSNKSGSRITKVDSGYKEFENCNTSIALVCQEAAYLCLRESLAEDEEFISASISLLALIAKDSAVRERHLYEADMYGLDIPVAVMKDTLKRALEAACRQSNDENDQPQDENQEQNQAELLRKSCLLLGALSDGNSEIARLVVDEGGLEIILNSINWYRYHEDVANWGLWAIFNIIYESQYNKIVLARCNGVSIVIQTIRSCPDSIEVARHGIAILFTLMGANDGEASAQEYGGKAPKLDVWKVRNAALAAGLHDVVVHSMKSFHEATDIMFMGQEMLAGTSYSGPIPQPWH